MREHFWPRKFGDCRRLISESLGLYADSTQSVIILGMARTGSTLLSSYLNKLGTLKSYGEVLNPDVYPFFKKAQNLPFKKSLALLKIKSTLAGGNRSVKLIFDHLERLDVTLQALQAAFPKAQLIIIYRKSLIRRYVSLKRAEATDEWVGNKGTKSSGNLSFYVDRHDFIEFCKRTKTTYRKCNTEALLARSITVDYEGLSQDSQTVLKESICPFLDIPYKPVKSSLKKQITTPLYQGIQNYDDIRDLVDAENTTLRFDRNRGGFY